MMTIEEAVKDYIRVLENDSPVVSRSHWAYISYGMKFGKDAWEHAVDDYFEQRKMKNKDKEDQ